MSFFPTDQDIERVQQALQTRIAAGDALKEELQALVRTECREVAGAIDQLRTELGALRSSLDGRLVEVEGNVAAVDVRFGVLAADFAKRGPVVQAELERLAQRLSGLHGELGAATQRSDDQATRLVARIEPAEERIGSIEAATDHIRKALTASVQQLAAASDGVSQGLQDLARSNSVETGRLALRLEQQQMQITQLESGLAGARRREQAVAVAITVLAVASLAAGLAFKLL